MSKIIKSIYPNLMNQIISKVLPTMQSSQKNHNRHLSTVKQPIHWSSMFLKVTMVLYSRTGKRGVGRLIRWLVNHKIQNFKGLFHDVSGMFCRKLVRQLINSFCSLAPSFKFIMKKFMIYLEIQRPN